MRKGFFFSLLGLTLMGFATGGRFCDNYVIRTRSFDGRYQVVSVPYFCTNQTAGCLQVRDTQSGGLLYTFPLTRLIGCVYVATGTPAILFKVPTGIGLSPVIAIQQEVKRPDAIVEIYRQGVVVDSVSMPAVYPTRRNQHFFFSGKRLDRAKVLYYKPDTLAVVTHKGLALITYQHQRARVTLTPDFTRVASFRLVQLDAHLECFPFPQPTSCAEVPELPPPTGRPRIQVPGHR